MSNNRVKSWVCGHCPHTWEAGPPKPYRCPQCGSTAILLAIGKVGPPISTATLNKTPPPEASDPANEADVMGLVAEVRKHAEAHYETGGWDFIVEAYTDQEVYEEVKHCTTLSQALAVMQEIVALKDERRREVRSTIW